MLETAVDEVGRGRFSSLGEGIGLTLRDVVCSDGDRPPCEDEECRMGPK